MNAYAIGHKNPDTDSVVAAIAFSTIHEGFVPAVACEINKETSYLLNRFGFTIPVLLPAEEKKVALVDTNNPEEFADNLKEDEIVSIVDHHKMGGIKTAEPVVVTIRVVGSTNTVLYELGKKESISFDARLASIMIGAIVSDTLNLTSPTTTDADRTAVEELNMVANLDIQQLADEMFAAKSDISDISTAELLGKDYKEFEVNGKKVGVGVWETVKPEMVLERKSEILAELAQKKQAEGLAVIVFACVDILAAKSDFFVVSTDEQIMLENIYGVKTVDSILTAEGVVSRKKQMNPQITDYLSK